MEKLNFRNRRRKNAYIIDERLSQRAVSLANYMIENKSTVRQAAKVFGVSKSTVHKDLTERLENIDSPGRLQAGAGRSGASWCVPRQGQRPYQHPIQGHGRKRPLERISS